MGCRAFFTKYMGIPSDSVDHFEFEHIEVLQQGRRSKIVDEVLVRFKTSRTRDMVQSYAPNLAMHAGKAGLRLNVPQHLIGLFKMYEVHGGKLKQRYGNGLKRSIKFDDATYSLAMDVRLPDEKEWIRLNSHDIIRITKERADKDSLFYSPSDAAEDRNRRVMLRSPRKNGTPVVVTSDDEDESIRIDLGRESSSSGAA